MLTRQSVGETIVFVFLAEVYYPINPGGAVAVSKQLVYTSILLATCTCTNKSVHKDFPNWQNIKARKRKQCAVHYNTYMQYQVITSNFIVHLSKNLQVSQ